MRVIFDITLLSPHPTVGKAGRLDGLTKGQSLADLPKSMRTPRREVAFVIIVLHFIAAYPIQPEM